jgi:tetratricopeptide (TPR) repeat protein
MTEEILIECPYCRGSVPANTTVCPDCGEDLAALAHLQSEHLIHYNIALGLAREGHYDEARTRLTMAIDERADFVPAHMVLAKIHAHQQAWEQAREAAERARRLAPDNEATVDLLQEIQQAKEQARVKALRTREKAAIEQRARAEALFSKQQRDLAAAFGLGAAAMGLLALLISWLGGGEHRD